MKFTTGLIALAMSATAAQAGSIQTVADTDETHPSLVLMGTAAPKAEPVKAEYDLGIPDLPTVDADGNLLDGRSQLEAWAKAHGTDISEILNRRLRGHYPEKIDEEDVAAPAAKAPAPVDEAAEVETVATDDQKTASVSPDAVEAKADTAPPPLFPEGKLREPE